MNSLKEAGSARATAITNRVSALAKGLRASLPSAPKKA